MSEALCMEIMARQLEAPGAPQAHRQALACLAPWMQNLSFAARWEGGHAQTCLCAATQTFLVVVLPAISVLSVLQGCASLMIETS